MICDISSPCNHSVNDGISSNLCSLQYARVNDAVKVVQALGKGTQLIKHDIKYRTALVHPDDYALLDIKWRGHTYIDKAPPFAVATQSLLAPLSRRLSVSHCTKLRVNTHSGPWEILPSSDGVD